MTLCKDILNTENIIIAITVIKTRSSVQNIKRNSSHLNKISIGGNKTSEPLEFAKYGNIVDPKDNPIKMPSPNAKPITIICSNKINVTNCFIDNPIVLSNANSYFLLLNEKLL